MRRTPFTDNMKRAFHVTPFAFLFLGHAALSQGSWPYPGFTPSGLTSRNSTGSSVAFKIYNDGAVFQTWKDSVNWGPFLSWPADGYPQTFYAMGSHSGLWFACQKQGKKLVSGANLLSFRIPWLGGSIRYDLMNQFVPGFPGDPAAQADTAFGGAGWRFAYDPNYIVYVSTDYNTLGVDVTGNNRPDWPIRLVEGSEAYVSDPFLRRNYFPVYKSEEDFFCIYKDTDTRADPEYDGAASLGDSSSFPIGIEVRQTVYSWSFTALKNAVVLAFEIWNRSGVELTGCYAGFQANAFATAGSSDNSYYVFDSNRRLGIHYCTNPSPSGGNILGRDSQIGFALLETPRELSGNQIGITVWKAPPYQAPVSDQVRYDWLEREPMIITRRETNVGSQNPMNATQLLATGPFTIAVGERIRLSVGLVFAIGREQLIRVHDYLSYVYTNGMTLPSPPPLSQVSAKSGNGSIVLTWDTSAERARDPALPDSVRRSFLGYRLYRAPGAGQPFAMVREWMVGRDDITHSYEDTGDSLNGGPLVLNREYIYKLTAFDEPVPELEIPSMENGGTVVRVRASTDPSSPFTLEEVRVVPNPYVVNHAAQQSLREPRIFFNFLPEQCTIRIYTVALDLVAEIDHMGGSVAEWDLRAQGGQQVASQLFVAKIETPQGTSVTKKFAVIVAD